MFFRVALPLARPAIVVGMSLALLETLNDIGASEFLGVQTLTVSVYTTWVTRSDLAGAAQIALTMLAIVVGLILLERHGRKRQRYANTSACARCNRAACAVRRRWSPRRWAGFPCCWASSPLRCTWWWKPTSACIWSAACRASCWSGCAIR